MFQNIFIILILTGAPISKEFNVVYLMSNADTFLSALGATRVRRDAGYDKEFAIDKYGLGIGLSYKDRSDKAGKFYFKLKDVNPTIIYIYVYIFNFNILRQDLMCRMTWFKKMRVTLQLTSTLTGRGRRG